jgi:putative CocE/NonD family hydrolase
MRDGTILRADIWLPGGDGAWPVLLQRTAYRKEDAFGAQYISGLEFMAALRRGYGVVVQDTRGRYGSDGEFVPFAHEADDGVDTIAWLRAQAFCNGQVMMFGASYVGATQVLAAAAAPQGLVAASPHLTTARHGNSWTYRGGATELGFLLLWIIESLGAEDLKRRLQSMPPGDAERARRLLAEMGQDPHAAYARLPLLDDDLIALAPYAAAWFDNQHAASAEGDREQLDALAATDLPLLVSAGWNDLFVEGAIELFETMRARRDRPEDVHDRLIIGPWSHGNPTDWQGDSWLGYAASTAGLSDEQLNFFDSARMGEAPKTPMVRYFRSGSNTWHTAPDWPLPGTSRRTLFLAGNALTDVVTEDWSRTYVSDTLDPVPTIGGASFVPGLLLGRNSGPKNQAQIEQRDDVLLFTSAPLAEDMEVTGLVEAALWVSSSASSADWTARLCEVDTAGRSIGLVDGIYRQQACSGAVTEIALRLGHLSHLFSKGNRIRLQLASSNYPRFDRNPQSGVPTAMATRADFVPAKQVVSGGTLLPSRLMLPAISQPFPTKPSFVGPRE